MLSPSGLERAGKIAFQPEMIIATVVRIARRQFKIIASLIPNRGAWYKSTADGLPAVDAQHQYQRNDKEYRAGEHHRIVISMVQLDDPTVQVWSDDGGEGGYPLSSL